jgi:adhesin/invasin
MNRRHFECALSSALMLVAMAVAGCERTAGSTKAPEAHELISDPARLSLTAGARGVLATRANDAGGTPIDGARLEFSASDPRLLRVTAQGEVTSLGPAGRTSILIASGSRTLTVPVDIVAGPAHRLEAVGASQRAIAAGTPAKDPIDVRLLDSFDNPVANAPVVFEAAIDPPVSLSTTTGADGVATIMLPAITRAGHFTLDVSNSENPQVSLTLDVQVNAAAPAALVAVNVPASGPVALFPDFELALQVRDAFGNPVPNVMVGWRTSSGSKSFDPPLSRSGADGQVRTRWQLTELKGRRATLRAFIVGDERIGFETWIALER